MSKTRTTTPRTKPDRWKAIRRGDHYCAPACGGGCTWTQYQHARLMGSVLATRLSETSGLKTWKAHVWENLGWHWSAVSSCGRIKVHQHSGASFTAFLGKPGSPGGQWAVHGSTPRQSVSRVVAQAQSQLSEIGATIAGLEDVTS